MISPKPVIPNDHTQIGPLTLALKNKEVLNLYGRCR